MAHSIDVNIPSPLPFLITLLPLILSPTVYLPASQLSTFVLLRHHFLKPLHPTSQSYLQASPNDSVEETREHLSSFSSCLEEIELSKVGYSAKIEEFGRIIAKVKLGKDGRELSLLVVWEEAQAIQQHQPASEQDGEDVQAGWRYYDLQPPTSSSNRDVWYETIGEALNSLIEAPGEAREAARTQASHDHGAVQQSSTTDDDDFWAGVEDSDDEGGPNAASTKRSANQSQDEDDYWAAYDEQAGETAIPDSEPTVLPPLDDARPAGGNMGNATKTLSPTPQSLHLHPLDAISYTRKGANGIPKVNGHLDVNDESDTPSEAVRQSIRGIFELYKLSHRDNDAQDKFLRIVEEATS